MNRFLDDLKTLPMKLSKESLNTEWHNKLKEVLKKYGASGSPYTKWLLGLPFLIPDPLQVENEGL
jgi:hypothetical protein